MKISLHLVISLLMPIYASAQVQTSIPDKEIRDILCKGTWSENPWADVRYFFVFHKDGTGVLSMPIDELRFNYSVANGVIAINGIEREEYYHYIFSEEKMHLFGKYKIVSVNDEKRVLFSSVYKNIYGEKRSFMGQLIAVGDVPVIDNEDESYFFSPSDTTPIRLRQHTGREWVNAYSLGEIRAKSDANSLTYFRRYIGSTVIGTEKWYLVSLIANPHDAKDGFVSTFAWTTGKPRGYPYLAYRYYSALSKGDFLVAYNMWHKKQAIDDLIALYPNSEQIFVLRSIFQKDGTWNLIVRTCSMDSMSQISYYSVYMRLSDVSILESKSVNISEEVVGNLLENDTSPVFGED